ncbi:hypothetical protein A4A49_17550 [Nicotiana attenuata]|uniref:DUF4283 domain-containing protein n=1 Tax=Nicotiana attenuata TaxID=49451 RepID=A0A1J6JBG3_NICAT|nr:hypothetical protein A4A49_17550 [Nicotiana attenuata]
MPAVIFKAKDYYGIMAEECKRTIVGRFLKPRPQIDRIRSSFREQFSMKGSVKIGVYDNIIDFTTEEDFKSIWYRRVIEIEGKQMWLQKWSPNFKPKEDSPIVPVWVLLPGLLFNMHNWHYVKQVLSSVGTPLTLDVATYGKTRPSMAKVRVEIDLLKSQLESIWVGSEDEDSSLKGFVQKLEYEGIPKYCKHCTKLGHNMMNCRFLVKKSMIETTKDIGNQNVDNSAIAGPSGKDNIEKKANELGHQRQTEKDGSKRKDDPIFAKEVKDTTVNENLQTTEQP